MKGLLSLVHSFTWKKVIYPNEIGLNLSGLLYTGPATDTVVIVCHGFTGSKEGGGRAIAMAEEMGLRGYATLLFDFSGCGESEGNFADISLTGHITDIKCSIDFCHGLGFNRVITMGRSFGGTAAICLGRANSSVAGVCTWAAPGNLKGVFSAYRARAMEIEGDLVPLSDGEGVYIKKQFFTDLDRYDVFGLAALIAPSPLLIIHGEDDQVVPVEDARSIFNAAGEPKKIQIIPGADHQFTGRHHEVWEVVFSWLTENFPV